MLGGLDTQMEGHHVVRLEGVRRVRNTFLVLALIIAALVLAVLLGGNSDAATGMAFALLAPTAVFTAISQFVLWYAEGRS